jgi:thiamine biosynthesis lipoprotein
VRVLSLGVGNWLLAAALAHGAETAVLEARAFGAEAHLEIEVLSERAQTRDALAEALAAIRRAEALVSPDPASLPFAEEVAGGLAELNRQAGVAPAMLDPDLHALLGRALDLCYFSEGAFSPLGGHLVRLWGLRQPVEGRPTLAALAQASSSAACERLRLERAGRSATLAPGSRADLLALERAFAVDRALAALRERGATNGWVQIGHVARAMGDGPDGAGWPIAVDATDPVTTPTERVLLRDRSLALAAAWADPIEIAGDREPPHLDQRTGRPATGTIAVLVVTETAVDAAGLAAALFVLPQRVGLFRLGALQPPPAVKWYLGSGGGIPLIAERGWAELPKWQPPRSPLERSPGG